MSNFVSINQDQSLEVFALQQLLTLAQRLQGEVTAELESAIRLLLAHGDRGDVCVDLNVYAATEQYPSLAEWREKLMRSAIVGEGNIYKPLMIDQAGHLYLQRYWQYEHALVDNILQRVAHKVEFDESRLQADLKTYFPKVGDEPDWQRLAAETAVCKRFTVIAGGPGTGKTTTLTRILALLVSQYGEGMRIALVAPTGKAAQRIQESVGAAKLKLNLPESMASAIPETAQTVHRLLGLRQDTPLARFNAEHPLPLDVLVLDEASMVDLALMAKLVLALPVKARLILLGDPDQLASVEAGAVMASLTALAETNSPIAPSIATLKRNYRYQDAPDIGKLAAAIRIGDADAVFEILDASSANVQWLDASESASQSALLDEIKRGYAELMDSASKQELPGVFQALSCFRVLCAHARGHDGSEALNRTVDQLLRPENIKGIWYAGRPVMLKQNDHALRLFNGDVGVAIGGYHESGVQMVFPDSTQAVRKFSLNRIPDWELAYSSTVHKSQGAEFDKVVLVLPNQISPVLTRELLYTAISRAKSHVIIYGRREVIQAAVKARVSRASGLSDLLKT